MRGLLTHGWVRRVQGPELGLLGLEARDLGEGILAEE
jgi:hypothetical protein